MSVEEKRGRGRPRLPEGTGKIELFTLRLSAEDRAWIEAAAQNAGKPATRWAREALLFVARHSASSTDKPPLAAKNR
jgi:hypothetical protein